MDKETTTRLLECLSGAVYCLTHDVLDGTVTFTVSQLEDMILKVKEL